MAFTGGCPSPEFMLGAAVPDPPLIFRLASTAPMPKQDQFFDGPYLSLRYQALSTTEPQLSDCEAASGNLMNVAFVLAWLRPKRSRRAKTFCLRLASAGL
jgi:hypothetical protein